MTNNNKPAVATAEDELPPDVAAAFAKMDAKSDPESDILGIKPNPQIVIDIKGWKMRQWRMFMDAASSEVYSSTIGKINELFAMVVKAWPYDAPSPTLADSYDDLLPHEWAEVLASVRAASSSAFQRV